MKEYKPSAIEPKWRKRWEDAGVHRAEERSKKPKKYILVMFPYPSGDGLHVGHAKVYFGTDVLARYWRMRGYNVLHPMGWDAFGLPTENTAIKRGVHPSILTRENIARFKQQMEMLGLSYDWTREITTSDPAYYRWTQWIFLQLFKKGLAYEATVPINWCPSCLTGLANEEVVEGACERCGTKVELRPMRQWLLRITEYAERLLLGVEKLDWPSFILELQRNWIGRSEGARIVFSLVDNGKEHIEVFTTRPDTLFGATYVVIAPEHPAAAAITTEEQRADTEAYVAKAVQKTTLDRTDLNKEKSGVLTGGYVLHPITGKKLPVWVADYVLTSYGTGAVMGVPAHDERDFAFAKKYDLPITQVVVPKPLQRIQRSVPDIAAGATAVIAVKSQCWEGEGELIGSEQFTGMKSEEARGAITRWLKDHEKGHQDVHYKLRDWVFSRQRYWGEPIPIIHCAKCGTVPVPEKDLPVTLPEVENYIPTGTGESPLAALTDWVKVACPSCGGEARRETNTMPQWAGSSWYWLRYVDPANDEQLAAPGALNYWLPVDTYIGGAEHAVLHLLYARFWTMVLYDVGVVLKDEPFPQLRNVGLLMGPDGQKMSKSRGNVIRPDDVVARFGSDVVRIYEMFMGPFDGSAAWSETGIEGANRFIRRIWQLCGRGHSVDVQLPDDLVLKVHRTTQKVTESTESLRFNTAISALMELLNALEKQPALPKDVLETYLLLLTPYAPHVCEELWQALGHTELISQQAWPEADTRALAKAKVTMPVQVNGRVRGTLEVDPGVMQAEVEQLARDLPNVERYLRDGTVIKVIYIPATLLNFVTKA